MLVNLKGSGTLMTSLYKEYAESWDTCVSVLTFLILILIESTMSCVLIKKKNVVWFLNQFGFTELMGTL